MQKAVPQGAGTQPHAFWWAHESESLLPLFQTSPVPALARVLGTCCGVVSLLSACDAGCREDVCVPSPRKHDPLLGHCVAFHLILEEPVPSGNPLWQCCWRDLCAVATKECLGYRCHLSGGQVFC